MRILAKRWRWVALGLAVGLVALGFVVQFWIIPALIVRQLKARYGGAVTIRSGWLGLGSSGVLGLALHEGESLGSPVWAAAERVVTDLTLGGLLRGHTTPTLITIQAPYVMVRLDRDGRLQTAIPVRSGGGAATDLPTVEVQNATVAIRQEGRPELVVGRIEGRLGRGASGPRLRARTDDPYWGPWELLGLFDPNMQSGTFQLTGKAVAADAEKVTRVPFVPRDVWSHVSPRGPIEVRVQCGWGANARPVETLITLRGTTVALPTLGLAASGQPGPLRAATGAIAIDGGLVRLQGVAGQAMGGRIRGEGTLDFRQSPAQFNLWLQLDQINVADAPKSWQLDEITSTGRLTGQAHLLIALAGQGADLTGSTGEAEVEGATSRGIPVKSLKLAMHASGTDLKYEGGDGVLVTNRTERTAERNRVSEPVAPPERNRLFEPRSTGAPRTTSVPLFRLPKTISTELELEDVDLTQILGRVEAMGVRLPLPAAGRLSLKVRATIPLGALKDLKQYAFHGEATLKAASIAGVDLGHVTARLDFEEGVLTLSQLTGRLVDLPDGGLTHRPAPTAPVPSQGALPPGGFRAQLRAELSPPGTLSASIEGQSLPIGELAAPVLPRPTPLSGLVTLQAEAEAAVNHLSDPRSWTVTGTFRSVRITYRETTLDHLATRFGVQEGRLSLMNLSAQLGGRPLKAQLLLDLKAPHDFTGRLDVSGWDLSDALAFVPWVPRPAPVDGVLTARANARGTLQPLTLQTQGQGRLDRFQVGSLDLGALPFAWRSEHDTTVVLTLEGARPFGGRLSAEARVPLDGSKRIDGKATAQHIDLAQLSAALPDESLKLMGTADGTAEFQVLPERQNLQANVRLSAPDLIVQGLPTEKLRAEVGMKAGTLTYDLKAESLGGEVRLRGEAKLNGEPGQAAADGKLQAIGFRLDELWPALGLRGPVARLRGLGAIDANLRVPLVEPALWMRGVAEVRDLRWGPSLSLGWLRGVITLTPKTWRVEPLTGTLLGGPAQATIWSEPPPPGTGAGRIGFEATIDQAELAQALGVFPEWARHLQGTARLRLGGYYRDGLRASGAAFVVNGRIYGLPLNELHVPVEISAGSGPGTLTIRHWTARLAGGRVSGSARFGLETAHGFRTEMQWAGIDLEMIVRLWPEVRRPASGRISGRLRLSGPDLAQLARYQGKVQADLDDASLVELPVFRELDRFLGSAHGGIFEDGDLEATIAHRQILIDRLTLVGRAVQLHAAGTIGFDSQLNLLVFVNTNEIIAQTGQALMRMIPGLRDVLGRRNEATARVAGFLANRLLKFRVTGTLRSPNVVLDPTANLTEDALGFFVGIFRLPLSLVR
jgi:translocation and assembly module TamB